MIATYYKNIFAEEGSFMQISECLNRIKSGESKKTIEQIRLTIDKEKANSLKKNLPSICLSGTFKGSRKDENLIDHSGFIVLDFDDVKDTETLKHQMIGHKFVKATWVSPSGKGVKALVEIADKTKHREHFESLREDFPEIDKSGINVSRVCYESYDPEIFINDKTVPYNKFIEVKKYQDKITETDDYKKFKNLLTWMYNRGDAFVEGKRNDYVFKLASACSRFGIDIYYAEQYMKSELLTQDNTFKDTELLYTIKNAYNRGKNQFGSAIFENDKLVDVKTRKEVELPNVEIDENGKFKDVVYGIDVKYEAMRLYDYGFEGAETTGIPEVDVHWKWKKGEITLLSGIGNMGKSSYLKYLMLMKSISNGWKFALFAPEDFPAHEFYHELTELYVGQSLTPDNINRISRDNYEEVYDWVEKHYFFVYPKDTLSSPDYIKQVFLELIVKEKVNAVCIDPFNQLDNDYSKTGGRDDRYLEVTLADFKRFAQVNDVPFLVVAHPKGGLKKDPKGNYECPDVYDLAGGAMYNNKMDNILIYHRPYRGEDPSSSVAEMHSKKIRRQKVVGKLGKIEFKLKPYSRRFLFNDVDHMEVLIQSKITNKSEPIQERSMFDISTENNIPHFEQIERPF
jgi:twinkle protein